jgi:hypothetical protein
MASMIKDIDEQGLRRALKAAVPGIDVWDSDRPYPVQVRGRIDGHRFYFRARDGWAFAVSERPNDPPSAVLYGGFPGWMHEEDYDNAEHNAGDMPNEDIVACIVKAVSLWRARKNEQHPIVEAHELTRLSTALLAYALWLELDPGLYDADEVGKELERLGILEPEEWRPAPWLVSAIKSFHGSEAETRGKADAQ